MVSPICLVCEWGWLKSWTQLELHVASLARWPQGSLTYMATQAAQKERVPMNKVKAT